MKKLILIIIVIVISLSHVSCSNGNYKSGGEDYQGYEIKYRILSDKQIEEIEKQIVFVDFMPDNLMTLVKECSVVAEVEIKSIDTIAYRREASITKKDYYFSRVNGIITNIFRGEALVTVGDKIKIETNKSFAYLHDLQLHLEQGKSYYMFLRDRGDHWSKELVEYVLILDTENYEHAISLLEE